MRGEDFEEGDVGAEGAVGYCGDESDDLVIFFGDNDVAASLEDPQVGFG